MLTTIPELTSASASSAVTIIAVLDARLPAPVAEAGQSITVTAAAPPLAAALGCAVGDGVLHIDQLYSDKADRFAELTINYFLL